MPGLVKNFNIETFSDTIDVKNVKLCIMILLIELYLFIPLSVTLTFLQGYSSVKQFELKMFMFLSD